MARGKNRKYSFQQYMTEAKVQPFELETGVEDGSVPPVIVLPVPDGDTLLEIGEKQNPRDILRLLCGDQFGDVMTLLGPAPAEVLTEVINDMIAHFGIGNPGDSRASSS